MVSDKGILLITGLFLFGVLFYSSYSDAITGYAAAEFSQSEATAALSNCVNVAGPGRAAGPSVPTGGSGARGLTSNINTFNSCLENSGIFPKFKCKKPDRVTGRTSVTARVGRRGPVVNVGAYDAEVSGDGIQRTSVGCIRGAKGLRYLKPKVLSVRAQKNVLYDPKTGILVARQIALTSINELRNQNQLNFGSGASGSGSGAAAASGGSGSAGTGTGGSGLNDNIEPTPTTSGVCECNGFVEYGEYLSGKFNTVLDRKGSIELGNPGSSDHYPDTENQVDVGENLMRTLSSSITFVHEERSIIRFTEISSTFATSGGYDVSAKGACIKRFSATPHDSSCGNCQEKCNAYLTGLNRIKIEYDKSDPSGCGQHLKKSMKDHLAQTITGGFEGITDVTFSYTPAPKVESVGICKTSGNAVS